MSSSLDYLELCRLCLVKDRVSVPIFEDEGDVRQIFLKITACLPVKVSREDKLPKKICDDCVYKVELFYQFWNTTANAEKQLLQWLGEVGGLEDKPGYVTEVLDTNVMKQETSSDSRLDGSVMQVGGHQNNMDMGMMDIITMPAGSEQQFTSVPMDTGGTVQTVQVVPGPSTQTTHDQMAQSQTSHLVGEESEEENSDDGCDNEEGLPVKEENDDHGDQPLETTFVALPCDEAGPSGLQQQKISELSEMSMQQTADNDPKTGKKRLPVIRQMSGKRLVFQKKLVKISKPLMGKLLSVATPMVQVKIEPSERPRSDDFEEVAIDGTSSTNDIVIASTAPKKHDFVVYMCKICKMYFPVRQMLESHNAKVHAPQKKSPVISRVVNKVVNQSTKLVVSPPKKRQKRLQLSALKPPESESPAEDQDRIYFTGYYKNSSGYYVCNSCDFSSRIRSTVASHATRKHNSCGLGNEEKPTTLSADIAEDCTKLELIEDDDEDSWPVEVIEEKQEEEEEEDNNDELNKTDPLADKQERSCPYCPFVSNIRSTYHSHVKRKHREEWLKSVAKRVADLRTTSSFATNTADNQLSCTACPFKSFKRSTMRSHFSRKHETTDSLNDDPDFADMQAQTEGKKVRKCPYCPFESWIYSTMNSHIMRNHGNQPHPLSSKSKPRYNTQLYTGYACHYCTFAGATVMSIRSHTAREHTGRKQPLQQVPVQEFDCDQCDYKTKSRRNMQLHLKDCHTMLANSEGMFQCHACSYETLSRMGLQRHVSIKHSMLGNTNISESAYFRCDHCDYKTLNSKLMDWHKRQHSEDENDGENDGNSYECNDCDFSTWTKAQLYQHIRRKHKDGEGNEKKEPELESDQLYACGQCDYVSKNKHAMKTHVLRKHTDDYPHECNLCEKKYKVKADLTNHIRFQHREQPIMCDVCGKTCRNSNLLYLHQKFAHYKPDFECHICHRRMVSQANLDEHILKQHEQVEESVCEECGKTFRKAARLKIHMRVHTGLKPYTCKICMKSFARRNGLRQHLLIHTGVRPYICDICGKSFTQKTGLICHRKMHPGDKPPLPRVTIDHVLTDLL